ncbi:MAG: (E)-4-hydroxy-3-methylbut-2-enyl-diphosphate synthase [Bacteroidales bacterium]|jgi:(E)-4-hydroxy-3-methylbut-2-enyl-diphosphate synthase|nr:(E)-4-hydroxy-3-methylbut-2-enyl-diphosphate synthase [Bacteroidales bacterium]
MRNINVHIGGVTLGREYPIVVQSMTNTPTQDVEATVAQIERLAAAGCGMVRVAVPSLREVDALAAIKTRMSAGIPLVADVHYLPEVALRCAEIADKVRINPGNYIDRPDDVNTSAAAMEEKIAERLLPLTEICKKYGTALRIGVNQGSLSKRILSQAQKQSQKQAQSWMQEEHHQQTHNQTTGISTIEIIKEQALVLSAVEFMNVCEVLNFEDTVYSIKSSDVRTMVRATEQLHEAMLKRGTVYPLHLGVTEAGNGQDGRILSAVGIGSLLLRNIGNTIRVSLTEKPENEIPVARAILQACGLGNFTTRFVACPSCGRTQYDIESVLTKIKERFSNYPNIKIAVMGCIVNGPGEMGDADYGYIGGKKGVVNLYHKGRLVKTNIPEERALDEFEKLIGG